ncbi:MAG: hypothetical protein HQM14_14480 [SAR324 cluster bacterium]|nr:hypothetical protein [SAR324 cluster bacterium]
MKMKNIAEHGLVIIILSIIRILPNQWAVGIGRLLGLFLYWIGMRRKVTMTNLEIAFGQEMTLEERTRLCQRIYSNLGSLLIEVFLMKFIPIEHISDYIEYEGLEVLDEAMQENQGAILAGGHFGHWELMAAGISVLSARMNIYSGQQRNPYFEKLMTDIREKFGTKTIPKSKTSFLEIVKVLKRKELFGILGDLNERSSPAFVDFFGKKASCGLGLPTFILKFKCPLLFVRTLRTSPFQHKVKIIRLGYELTGDREKDIQHISQLFSSQLEKEIRLHPDQYFWVNKRWKTRPPEEKNQPPIY